MSCARNSLFTLSCSTCINTVMNIHTVLIGQYVHICLRCDETQTLCRYYSRGVKVYEEEKYTCCCRYSNITAARIIMVKFNFERTLLP